MRIALLLLIIVSIMGLEGRDVDANRADVSDYVGMVNLQIYVLIV